MEKVNKCKRLEEKLDKARIELEDEMKRLWPEGCMVAFTIRYKQKTASEGEVIHHHGPYLRVRLNTVYGKVVDVHYERILASL